MNFKKIINEVISEYLLLELTADEIKSKYYPNIEQNVFDLIVKSDKITSNYERGKVGNYAKWLLKLYSNNKLNINDLSSVNKHISIFDKLSKANRLETKDINKYNSLDDMYKVIEPYLDTNKPISNKDKEGNAKLIYKDSRFVVIQPLDKNAAIKYGKGTTWCTASTKADNEFDNYNQKGALYIIFDKSKRNSISNDYEKYQIQFQTGFYSNSDDNNIDFSKNPELIPIIKKIVKIVNINPIDLIRFGPRNILFINNPSEDVQLKVVRSSGSAIKNIIEKGITPSEQVQLEAVKNNGYSIKNIIEKGITPSEQVQLEAVKEIGGAIQFIKNPSEEVQLEAVKKYGYLIKFIVENGITPSEQVQLEAVKDDGYSIKNIIEKGITPSEQVQLEAVRNNSSVIGFIKNPSKNVINAAVNKNTEAIKNIQFTDSVKYADLISYVELLKKKYNIE